MSNQFFQYSLNPVNNRGVSNIITLNPAQADGFVKSIIKTLSLCKPTKINIVDSELCHWLQNGAGFVSINLKSLLKAKISMGLINHRDLKSKLQDLNNGSDLLIRSIHEGQFYQFVAGTLEVELPAVSLEDVKKPTFKNLNNAVEVGTEIEIKDTRPLISRAKAKDGPVEILIYSGQLSALRFSDGTVQKLSQLALCEPTSLPERTFRSYAFLRCTGKEAKMKILKVDDEHYLSTESLIGVGIKARLIDRVFDKY